MSDAFQAWLESNDCYERLLKCSDQVISRARKKAVSLEAIFHDALTDGLNDLSHVVAHEMWQFLIKQSHRVAERASDKLVHGDLSGFMEVLIGSFLDNCKDRRRTISVDPVYAYYRSIRTVLSKSNEVNTQPTQRGTFFAFSFDESLQQLPYKYCEQSYSDWPHPPHSEQEIYESSAILELASYFWVKALDRFTTAYLLPIKELSLFLNTKYQIGCKIDNEGSCLKSNPDGESESLTIDDILVASGHTDDVLGNHSSQNPRIELDIIESELEELAKDCLSSLSETERVVLCRTESGVKMMDIASELNMKSASNVSYHQGKAYEKLKRTWSLWGTESAENFSDVDEEEFWIFYDKVIIFCKSADQRRRG